MKNYGVKQLIGKLNNNPKHILASLTEIREVAARICRDYLTGQWKTIAAEDLIVKRISGGLSNLLYYISLPQDDTNSSSNNNNSPIKNAEKTTQTQITQEQTLCDKARANNDCFFKRSLPSFEIDNGNRKKRQRSNSGEIVFPTSASGFMQNIQDTEPREVLMRIYGQTHGENALEAMITESVVFALLSERNFGPKLHGIFPGGRIEQYIPAVALTTAQLSDHKISMKIAEKMGEIHSLNIPMSKEPDWLWNSMERWLKGIGNILKDFKSKDPGVNVDEIESFDFLKERKWLKSVIDSKNYPVLFCHNDLQEGNILLRESDHKTSVSTQVTPNNLRDSIDSITNNTSSTDNDNDNTQDTVLSNLSEDSGPDLIIIDFEYCAYNYRGFDLANHFIEWTIDYCNPVTPFYLFTKSQYPTQKQRYDFIVTYLKKLNESVESYVPSESEVEAVDEEVRVFSMFSHLFWSLWSVVNMTSNIEFGYRQYAVSRIREYKYLKQQYLLKR